MEMTINTKFNIGDAVYTVGVCHGGLYAQSRPGIIKTILTQTHAAKQSVSYGVVCKSGFIDTVPEQWCFATYDECATWCEQHN